MNRIDLCAYWLNAAQARTATQPACSAAGNVAYPAQDKECGYGEDCDTSNFSGVQYCR